MADLIAHRFVGLRNQTFDMFVSIQGYFGSEVICHIHPAEVFGEMFAAQGFCVSVDLISHTGHVTSSFFKCTFECFLGLSGSWSNGNILVKYGNSFVLIMLLLY